MVLPLIVGMLAVTGVLGGTGGAGAAVGVPVTYVDHKYASDVKNPTADKPQSKLWYTDGFWWALMTTSGGSDTHIFKLDSLTHEWTDTGTAVDTRTNSTGDALWTAKDRTLTIVARDSSSNPLVSRFTYSPGSDQYTLDSGFPIAVDAGGGSESATIDRDSTGKLWIAYTRANQLWVAHSDVNGLSWTSGFHPAVGDYTLTSDDIASVIAFNGNIGVMWSDQGASAMRFAIHRDGTADSAWTVEDALAGTRMADDHINLKQITGDPSGQIFAAIKTSKGDVASDAPTDPLVGVLVRTPATATQPADWKFRAAGTVADNHTRPIIAIDQTNRELYFFGSARGNIYYKKTDLDHPDFSGQPGLGEPFVDAKAAVNNATASKDAVTADSGLVILASSEGQKRYVHAEMELAAGTPPPPPPGDTTPPAVPTNLSADTTAGNVKLTWNASSDTSGVKGYQVYRGAVKIGTTTSPTTSFTDSSGTPGVTYAYSVAAEDNVGNVSAKSSPALQVQYPQSSPPPSSGAIELRDSTTAANDAEKTLTVPVPTTQTGDLLLASVAFRGKGNVTTPSGWALVQQDASGKAIQLATYSRIAVANEPPSYVWQFSAKPGAVGTMLAYSGVSASGPIQVSNGQSSSTGKTITAPSVTTTAADSLLVAVFTTARFATLTSPAGMSEVAAVVSPGTVKWPASSEVSAEPRPSSGPTGARDASSTMSGPSIAQSIVLNPA